MDILVLGGDGYLGWPTAMYLSKRGHRVGVLDNFAKRRWEMELNVEPLIPILTLHDRVKVWRELGEEMQQKYESLHDEIELLRVAIKVLQEENRQLKQENLRLLHQIKTLTGEKG